MTVKKNSLPMESHKQPFIHRANLNDSELADWLGGLKEKILLRDELSKRIELDKASLAEREQALQELIKDILTSTSYP